MAELIQKLLPGTGPIVSLVGAGGKTTLMFHLAHELEKIGEPVLTTTTTKIYIPEIEQSLHVHISKDPLVIIDRSLLLLDEALHLTAARTLISETNKLGGFTPEEINFIGEKGPFKWILVEADGAAQRPLKAPAPHEPIIPEGSICVIAVIGLDAIGKPLDEQWVFRSKLYSQLTGQPPPLSHLRGVGRLNSVG